MTDISEIINLKKTLLFSLKFKLKISKFRINKLLYTPSSPESS